MIQKARDAVPSLAKLLQVGVVEEWVKCNMEAVKMQLSEILAGKRGLAEALEMGLITEQEFVWAVLDRVTTWLEAATESQLHNDWDPGEFRAGLDLLAFGLDSFPNLERRGTLNLRDAPPRYRHFKGLKLVHCRAESGEKRVVAVDFGPDDGASLRIVRFGFVGPSAPTSQLPQKVELALIDGASPFAILAYVSQVKTTQVPNRQDVWRDVGDPSKRVRMGASR